MGQSSFRSAYFLRWLLSHTALEAKGFSESSFRVWLKSLVSPPLENQRLRLSSPKRTLGGDQPAIHDAQPIHQHGRCAMKPRSPGYVRRSAP